LQAAFDSDPSDVGNILIASSNGVVQVEPLFIRQGHRTIRIAPGVELQAMEGAFHGVSDSLLSVLSVENLQLVVTGATLKMRKLEYLPPLYIKAEWRSTLLIRQSRNLTVIGGTYKDSGGDGVFVESSVGPITLLGVVTDGAWRNGLSVIGANGLLVVDSEFLNTNGTDPQCGIDVEPWSNAQAAPQLAGIRFRNISLRGNSRCGFSLSPGSLVNASAVPVLDVEIDGMNIVDTIGQMDQYHSTNGVGIQLFDSFNMSGHVTFRDVYITRAYASALLLGNWPSGFISLLFDGLTITNVTHGEYQPLAPFGPVSPVVINPTSCHGSCVVAQRCPGQDPTLSCGGVKFVRTTVSDTKNRAWLSRMWNGSWPTWGGIPPPLTNLSGTVTVHNPTGCLPAAVGQLAENISLKVVCQTARLHLKTEDTIHFVDMQGPHGPSVVAAAAAGVTALILPGGALQLRSESIVVTVASTFSAPGQSYHTHYSGPSREFNRSLSIAAQGWKVQVQTQPGPVQSSIIGTVSGMSDLFRVDRVYFRAQDGFIKVNDTITAAVGQELVGVQQRHYASVRPAEATITQVIGPGSLQVGDCSTSGISGVATEAAKYGEMVGIPYYVGTEGNPSVFASTEAIAGQHATMGVGLIALDDVFMVHAETANHATCNTTATMAMPWAPAIQLADPHFGLAGGASHTQEWAVFAAGSNCSSYYCFVNQVRHHQGMTDVSIQRNGAFDHQWIGVDIDGSPRPYGDWRNWTTEKTRRIIKENGLKYIISAIPWTNKTSACEKNNWKYAQGSAFVHEASPTFDQYIRDLVRVFTAADADFKVLVYFHSFESGETNASQKYYGDRILRADLTQQCYGRCCAEWPLFFPATLKDGQLSPYAQQLDLYLDKVFSLGAHGLYHDESSYSLNPYTYLVDDSRWDGVSVAFNWSLFPVAKISSVELVRQPHHIALMKRAAARGVVSCGR
jgi:hypothetical protein